LLNGIRKNYPGLQKDEAEFKANLHLIKETVDSFNVGALDLKESFKNHLMEVDPWVSVHNMFTNSVCVLLFMIFIAQCGLLIGQNTPKYKHIRKYNYFIWVSTFAGLTCLSISSHFQGSYASVNHDMCLLFKLKPTG
jgi:hypothetical protein